MKSIKSKFLALVITCVTAASLIVGAIGAIILNRYADKTSATIMNKTCELEAEKLSRSFLETEHATTAFAEHIMDTLDTLGDEQEKEYLLYYSEELSRAALSYASNTTGVMSVYVRFSPEFSESPVSGVFYVKNQNGIFEEAELTDLSLYEKTELTHVGWYYVPIENGSPMWMSPYMNDNISVYMISYVVPLFDVHGNEIGIVGMDIDFNEIGKKLSEIDIYESGCAFLLDGTNIAFHDDIAHGGAPESMAIQLAIGGRERSVMHLYDCTLHGEEHLISFNTLRNGMQLILAAPKSEINAERNHHVLLIGISALAILAISSVLTAIMTSRLVRPLRELNQAAERIANGDLNTEIEWHSNDETGILAESFRKTTEALRKNDSYIKEIAYRDSLTGVRNATAYHEAVSRISSELNGDKKLSVAVFDINDLKLVNDNLGHAYGDILIESACGVIRRSFTPSPVFRIGGDEFAVLLENEESGRAHEHMERFISEVAGFNELGSLGFEMNIAAGYAEYDPAVDSDYPALFNRADKAMYANKKLIKKLAIEGLKKDDKSE